MLIELFSKECKGAHLVNSSDLHKKEWECCSSEALVYHITGLNRELCSIRSEGVWDPRSKSFAPYSLTLLC